MAVLFVQFCSENGVSFYSFRLFLLLSFLWNTIVRQWENDNSAEKKRKMEKQEKEK